MIIITIKIIMSLYCRRRMLMCASVCACYVCVSVRKLMLMLMPMRICMSIWWAFIRVYSFGVHSRNRLLISFVFICLYLRDRYTVYELLMYIMYFLCFCWLLLLLLLLPLAFELLTFTSHSIQFNSIHSQFYLTSFSSCLSRNLDSNLSSSIEFNWLNIWQTLE